jgi:hypothetical protein
MPRIRLAIAALVEGVGCGIGSAICGGLVWEQKTMICFHGGGICVGVAARMNEADPSNPAMISGKVAGDALVQMSA